MKFWVIALSLFALSTFIYATFSSPSDRRSSAPPAGTRGTLKSSCPSMPTLSGYEELSKDLGEGDRVGAARLIADRGGAILPKGMEVMMKAWHFPGYSEVTVQTLGENMGKRAFISWACTEGK